MKIIVVMAVCFFVSVSVSKGQNEKSISNGMPNRISMNVTVPKQTQGATFGEKVNAGLSAAGSYVVFPNKQAFLITSDQIKEIGDEEASKVNAGLHAAGSALAQGASRVGGALPGGAIISAAVSRTGQSNKLWQISNVGNEFKMPSTLTAGEYELLLDMAAKDNQRIQVVFGLLVESGTYKVTSVKAKHDTVKNSINNVR